jgi:ribosomal protein L16/L10AE
MGKGKGSFLRWVTRLSRGHTILEFKGVNYNRIIKINKEIKNNLGITTYITNFSKVNSF